MTSWVPEELPPERELAPVEPAELAPPGQQFAAQPTTSFGTPPSPFSPMQALAAPALAPTPRSASRPPMLALGIAGTVVVVLAIGVGISLTNGSSPPSSSVYLGAPVEASDASDGATIVGLGDTIAYVPEANWRDVTEYLETEGATGPAAVADDVVGVHTFDGPDGRNEFVVVLGHRGSASEDPTARFAAILAEVYGIDAAELSGPVRPVQTALGLNGAVGVFDRPLVEDEPSGERLFTRFAILGQGGNAAIVEWMTFGAAGDEAAFQRLVDSVRVDS